MYVTFLIRMVLARLEIIKNIIIPSAVSLWSTLDSNT